MSSNSSVLTIIPPPAGQTSNFVNPHSTGVGMTVTNVVCISVSVIAVTLRMFTRYWLVNSVKLDDYLVLLALACAVSGSLVAQNMIPYGLGKHAWDVPFTSLSPFLKRWMIGAITYSSSILMTKLSFLFLYRRLFTNNKSFALQWWIVLVVVIGYSIGGILSSLLACLPIAMAWDVTITDGVCINKAVFYIVNACLNVLTDLGIFALPIIPIWQTFSSRRQRIFLSLLFGTGSFTCVVSMIRIKYIVEFLKYGAGDITRAGTSLVIWTVIEMHSAIICACAATLKPFIQRYFGPIFASIHDSKP